MSLEERLTALTEAVIEQNNLLREVIGLSKSGTSTAAVTAATSTTTPAAEGGVRERGKPAPGSGRTRRTKEEIAEDEAAEAAEAAANSGSGANTATENSEDDDAKVPDDLKKALGDWLGEFAKPEDKDNPDGTHPEVVARKAALKKAFEGLGVEKLGEIKGSKDVGRLAAWFEKAKVKDAGFGVGRFAADPEPAADDEDEDELGI